MLEDSRRAHDTQMADLRTTVEQLQAKVDDLVNRKNLRIIGLPEKAEGNEPLTTFLQKMLPVWLQLPVDFPAVEIERAHRAPLPSQSTPSAPQRSVIVHFLCFPVKEAVLQAAKKSQL